MKKQLHVTVDFVDDKPTVCTPEHLDRKLEYYAALGVCRLDWMWDIWSDLYREPFGGATNRLAYAVEKARDLGMEVHAVFKPFETGFHGFPHTFPQPDGMQIWQNLNAMFAAFRDPFIVEHPEMCFARKPEPPDPGGAVACIKLVKSGVEPTRIRKEHLALWTGALNGRLEPCPGTFEFSVGIERRPAFPPDALRMGGKMSRQIRWFEERDCLVLTLDGLAIPEEHRYIEVRCSLSEGSGDFWNTPNELMEIRNIDGMRIPSSPGTRGNSRFHRLTDFAAQFTEYGRCPAVREFFRAPEQVRAANRDVLVFSDRVPKCLDGESTVAVGRGFVSHLPILNPVYSEVRAHWLRAIEEAMDCGVAGINIRPAGHSSGSSERDEYGFNAPVLEACGGRVDRDRAREVIGSAWTDFLRDARERTRRRGLPLSLHINSGMVVPDGRDDLGSLPPNVEWQWRTWIKEGLADAVCLKDGPFLQSQSQVELFIDRVTRVAGARGVPVVWLNPTGTLRFEGGNHRVAREMAMVASDDRFAAFNLYESANITRFDGEGRVVCSRDIADMVRSHAGSESF